MKNSEKCKTCIESQSFPSYGILKDNANKNKYELLNIIKGSTSPIYSYIVDTLKICNGKYAQTGCGPNYQGGLITLCTCKHRMRTGKPTKCEMSDVSDWLKSWNNIWIAGVSGIHRGKNDFNSLFYLMNVMLAFQDHESLWEYLKLNYREAATAKRADQSMFGDIYPPNTKPCTKHVHNVINEETNKLRWEDDVNYQKGHCGRKPALLVGDPLKSFIWTEPSISFKDGKLPRTKKWDNIQEFAILLD